MLKNQKGFHLVLPLLIVVVLGAIGLVGVYVISNQKNGPSADRRGPNFKALTSCGQQPLTAAPADLAKLEQIAPLGGVDSPDHTLPTDHMYMVYTYGETSQKDVFAPANIVITGIGYSQETFKGEVREGDYGLSFSPCKELELRYGHIDVLSDKIKAVIGTPENPGSGKCETKTQETSVITSCNWETDITLAASDLVGTTNGWDLWATYQGSKGKVLSPQYYHNVDAVCPLDYWTDNIKTQMYGLVRRTTEPKCGEAYIDVAGTLIGGWFAHKDPEQAKSDWSSHFSLSHHATTGIGQVAVAGTIADEFMYNFTPKHSGTINVEPSETKAGTLYCYQHEGDKRFPNGRIAGDGKILIKLVDDHTAQIEHVATGNCGSSEALSKPTTYYR